MALLTFLFTAGSAPTFTAGATPTLTPGPRPWPTDNGDNRRSGSYPSGTLFRHLTKAWGRGLDGAIYGSPIAVGGFVFVATENNSVYKISSATGAIRWRRHLRAPAPTSSLACPGNISPSGITGSPAYDPVTNRIFVVTNSVNARLGAHHEIFGLNATTGATEVNRRVAVPGQAENAEQQRGALAVAGGNVYIPFGGLAGDCGQYKGAVISLKANGRLGGIGGKVSSGPLCSAFGVSAVTGNTVYLPCTDGLSRVEVSSTGHFKRVWRMPGVTSSPVAGHGALYTVAGSSLLAINGAGRKIGSIALASTPTRFATPAQEGNKVFVGTTTGVVAIRVG